MSFSKEEREIYEAERKKRMDAYEELRTAIEKGKKEGKIEIAKNLITAGMTMEQIVSITGLASCELKKNVAEKPPK